jgi:hypothetical protein
MFKMPTSSSGLIICIRSWEFVRSDDWGYCQRVFQSISEIITASGIAAFIQPLFRKGRGSALFDCSVVGSSTVKHHDGLVFVSRPGDWTLSSPWSILGLGTLTYHYLLSLQLDLLLVNPALRGFDISAPLSPRSGSTTHAKPTPRQQSRLHPSRRLGTHRPVPCDAADPWLPSTSSFRFRLICHLHDCHWRHQVASNSRSLRFGPFLLLSGSRRTHTTGQSWLPVGHQRACGVCLPSSPPSLSHGPRH